MAVDTPAAQHFEQSMMARLDAEFDKLDTPETPAAPPVTETKSDAGTPPAAQADVQAGPPPETPSEPAKRSAYDDWLSKYQGDKEKAAAEAWEKQNQNKTLAEQLAERERELEELRAQAVSPPEPVEPEIHPQIAEFDSQLRATEQTALNLIKTAANYKTEAQKYQTAINQQNIKISALTERLASGSGDFEAEQGLKRELAQLLQDRKGLERGRREYDQEVLRLDAEAGRLVDKYEGLRTTRGTLQRMLDLEQARAATESERLANQYEAEITKDAAEYRKVYDTLAEELSIPQKQHKRFREFVAGPLISRLSDLEAQGIKDGIRDLPAAMRERALDFKMMLDEEAADRMATYTKQKQERTAVEGPTGKAAVVGSATPLRKRTDREVFDSIEF